MLDSQSWRCAEPPPRIRLNLDVDTARARAVRAVRTPAAIAFAEGTVTQVTEARLEINGPSGAALRFLLPPEIDLAPLLGARVRVTLREQGGGGGAPTQTLTVTGADGAVRLVAHYGAVTDASHALGDKSVSVALSQRSGGPLVVGTKNLKFALAAGDRVELPGRETTYVVSFVARSPRGAATYVVADARLVRA